MHPEQRRKFSRIPFHGDARLLVDDREIPCSVCDISMKGALLEAPGEPDLATGTHCLLELRLGSDSGAVVRMEGNAAHVENSHIGIAWREIDLDSLIHLRRLLELNLADQELFSREFSALISG